MGLLDSIKFAPEKHSEDDTETEPLFEQDPEPGQRPARGRAAKKTAPTPAPKKPPATTARMAKEVAENLTTLIEIGASIWGMSGDQCCAPVLEKQAKPMADTFTAILARNPRMLAQFANADFAVMTVQTIAFFNAVAPVVKAVYRNHVSKTVDDDEGHIHNGSGAVNLGNFPAYGPGPR